MFELEESFSNRRNSSFIICRVDLYFSAAISRKQTVRDSSFVLEIFIADLNCGLFNQKVKNDTQHKRGDEYRDRFDRSARPACKQMMNIREEHRVQQIDAVGAQR